MTWNQIVQLLYLALCCVIVITERLLHLILPCTPTDAENDAETDTKNNAKNDITSHLPDELLAAIFTQYARNSHFSDPGFCARSPPHWVNVSYVCHRWGAIALRCANLWAHHFWVSPRWSEVLLARARQVPLKVHITIDADALTLGNYEPMWKSMETLLYHHTERIQELQLCILHVSERFANQHSMNQIVSALSSRAPRLEHLRIQTPSVPRDTASVHFEGYTPSLRTLELSRWSFRWYSLALDLLTILDLRHLPGSCRQSIGDFIATLSHMRELREIYLIDAIAGAATGGFISDLPLDTSSPWQINMPHLSRLWVMEAPNSAAIAILACVRIPANTEVRIESYFDTPSQDLSLPDHPTYLSKVITRQCIASDDRRISSLIIQFRKKAVAFVFSHCGQDCEHFSSFEPLPANYPAAHHRDCSQGHSHGSLEISIRRNRWLPQRTAVNWSSIAVDICCAIPPLAANVQNIRVIRPPHSPIFWGKILGYLQALQYVKLSDG